MVYASCIIAICFSMGCAFSGASGTKLDQGQVAQIQKGTTTRAQIEAMFGPPAGGYTMMPNGARQASWYYTKSTQKHGVEAFLPVTSTFAGYSATTEQQRLTVMFNSQNVVEDFDYSGGTTKSGGSPLSGYRTMSTTADPPLVSNR
jgi:outer membrane protein assembly factor BamE (lipoprotein component of BamABCDE complex)